MQIEIFSGKNNSGMAKKLVLLFFLSLFLSLPLKGQRQEQITLQLIPYPQKLVFGEGTFFSKNPDVVFSGTSSEEEKILMNELRSLWSTIDRKKKVSGKDIIFRRYEMEKNLYPAVII